MCLPGRTGWNTCRAEQSPCDVSVSFATLVGVEGSQGKCKTLTPLRADWIRRVAARSAHRDTPQTSGCGGPCGEICIKGDNDCCRVRHTRAVKQREAKPAMGSVDQPILALGASLSIRWAQSAHGLRVREDIRALCQNDSRWIKLRQPSQRSDVGAQVRIDWESATPNASLIAGHIACGSCACQQRFENCADNQDCVEGTPRQIRQDQDRSGKHKQPEIANRIQIVFVTCWTRGYARTECPAEEPSLAITAEYSSGGVQEMHHVMRKALACRCIFVFCREVTIASDNVE